MERSALEKACFEGKTASSGGMNLAEMRKVLIENYPTSEGDIRQGSRLDLEDLCRSLLQQPKGKPVIGVSSVSRAKPLKQKAKPSRLVQDTRIGFRQPEEEPVPVPPRDVPCPSGNIEVLQEYNPHTFLVLKNGVKQVMKIITKDIHPWNATSSFKTYFKSDKQLLERISENYHLFDRLGVGQKVVEEWCPGNKLYLFLEYLPYRATEKLIEEHEGEIRDMIADLHRRGIVHGDLHGGNIMFDKNMKPVIIDLDTVFHLDELKDNPLPMEWLKRGFDITDLDEYLWKEATENFQVVIDE